jgi:WD40 repeat protein
VFSVSSDSTGERIVSGCRDGLIRVIRVPTGLIERTIEVKSPIYGVAFELEGTRFAVAAKEVLRVVDAESGEIQHMYQIGTVVHSTSFDTSGLLIAAGSCPVVSACTLAAGPFG